MRLAKLLFAAVVGCCSSLGLAQNEVKHQDELPGPNVVMGETYSLSNSVNFTLLAARYTLEPCNSYEVVAADPDSKILVIDIAIKNANAQDLYVEPATWFVAIDDKQQVYQSATCWLDSQGRQASTFNLRPAQGIGQAELKDNLHVAFKVPNNARIAKIMVNLGRLGKDSEKVMRYPMVAPPAKPEAKGVNYIKPLPANLAAPGDAYGSTRLKEGKASIGVAVPTGKFHMTLDALAKAAPEATFDGNPAPDGKEFWVATLTVENMIDEEQSMYEVYGGDFAAYMLTDADGEQYKSVGARKKAADENPERTFKKGDKYTFRVFVPVTKGVKPTKFNFGAGQSPVWSVDVAG